MSFTLSRILCLSLVASLLVFSGCEESYRPAAYKPAPRVGPGGDPSSVSRDLARNGSPNLTQWTSPGAVRGGGAMPVRGYRGIGDYRGIGAYRGMGYRGIAGYRGIGGYRGVNGNRGDGAYRGISAYRGWNKRGNTSTPYRGY